MPLVTYNPFLVNAKPSGGEVYDRFYDYGSNASFENINGRLDLTNLATGIEADIGHTMLQDNSVSGGGMVAGTANLDYFGFGTTRHDTYVQFPSQPTGFFFGTDSLGGYVEGSATDPDGRAYIAIPGASIQFYLPFKACVLLTWQIMWTSDSDHPNKETHIRLFIDDSETGNGLVTGDPTYPGQSRPTQVRRSRETMFGYRPGWGQPGNPVASLKSRYKSRYWSGHHFVGPSTVDSGGQLSRGWHSASLRILSRNNVRQARVFCRNMKYIYFLKQDA
tara:strand:- start:3026 stop:3856 length:831 start_codon:yes stop_codon:yes gene_type:complete